MSDTRPDWARPDPHVGEPAHTLGERGPKIDGLAKIRGTAQFVDDLRRPRQVVGKFVRSPYAHARIVSIDVSAALALPGVVGTMVGTDLPKRYGPIPVGQDETALALDKVRYVGEPVVCVVATDEGLAYEACRLVKVVYERLPEVLTIDDALAEGAPLVHDEARKPSNVLRRVYQSFGDVDAGFLAADVMIESDYDYPGSTHVPLEPHAALAEVEPDGRLVIWSSTQNPHYLHKELARALDLPEDRVRVIKPAVGAGYGGKCDPMSHEMCAAWLARKLGRPVKISLEREEVFYAHRGRHPTRMRLKLGATRDGRITAIEFFAWADGGAYASYGVVTAYYLGVFMTLPYHLGAYRFTAHRLYTNKPPCGPKRGHGAIQPRFALEVHLDKLALALGMDPAELRRKNCIEAGHETINGLRVGSVGARECIDAVVAASGYATRRGQLGPGRGLGLAVSAYMCGALHPVHDDAMSQSSVLCKLDRSGEVTVFSGAADIGQGSTHLLALLAAERLGVTPADVRVVEADTALTPVDLGSYSSRVTFMAGNACLKAVDAARARLFDAVALKLGVEAASLDAKGGHIGPREAWDRAVSLRDAIRLAEELAGPVATIGSYKPAKVGNRFRRQSVGPSPAYSFTAQVAEVEVDLETGIPRVVQVWVAHDCGRVLQRSIAEGQVEGCVYMGVGEALYEEQVYDRRGRLFAPSLLEYKIPTVHETPLIHTTLVETHEPEGPYGAKEVGEGPQLSTVPAIANALYDATGVWFDKAPFTPDRILRGLPAVP